MDKIISAFDLAGISFTPTGIEEKDISFVTLSGPNRYLRVLEDVEKTYELTPKEDWKDWITIYPDDRKSPPAIVQKIKQIREKGVMRKHFIEEGNTYIQWKLSEYRHIPKKHFNYASHILCYGDKVAIIEQTGDPNPTDIYIIRNLAFTSAIRGLANLLWDILPEPRISTCPEEQRY